MRSDGAQLPFSPLTILPAGYRRLASLDERRKIALLRIAVLASPVLLMLPGAWGHSVTVVEFAHLPAGLAAWQRHSLAVYRVCAPLSKFLYALPAHLAGVRVDYPGSFDTDIRSRKEWDLGEIFQQQNRGRYHALYRWSRLLPMLVTLLGGCIVCEWSTRLFGAGPGLVSLCVWCWMPPVLAHGSLVTSDMLSAVTLLLAARCFWSFLMRPGPATTLLAGVALGLAQATKFTLLILYPCWGLLLVARAAQMMAGRATRHRAEGHEPGAIPPASTRPSPARLIASGLILGAISLFMLDALYLFQGVGFRLAEWRSGLSSFGGELHRLCEEAGMGWLLRMPLPIPLEMLRGLDCQVADAQRLQSAYLLGQTRLGGWWYWYAAASLIKFPIPVLILFSLSILRFPAACRDREPLVWAALLLLLPATEAALLIAATTGTGTNAAFRYLLPSAALACVWIGHPWRRPGIARRIVIGLLAWLGLETATSLPDHLGWQNEVGQVYHHMTGRPALAGDSLDWGQDLSRLGEWVSRHSDEGSTIVCAYGFGEGEPYGLAPPRARSTSGPWDSTYLAVSEGILLDPINPRSIVIAGRTSAIGPVQRQELSKAPPFARVGRTIRIYRLRDRDRRAPPPGLGEG